MWGGGQYGTNYVFSSKLNPFCRKTGGVHDYVPEGLGWTENQQLFEKKDKKDSYY